MPFAVVAVPFDVYRELPSPAHRWLLACLARYTDKGGKCWPSMRQLADDARMSLSTVCRRLAEMAALGVFQRTRRGRGVYRYTLEEPYRPRWPGRVSAAQPRVSGDEKPESRYSKQSNSWKPKVDYESIPKGIHDATSRWPARIAAWLRSGGRFWGWDWGPKPNEPGCWAPWELLARLLPQTQPERRGFLGNAP